MIGSFVVALQREAHIAQRAAQSVGLCVPIRSGGIGPLRARLAAQQMLVDGASALLSIGFAGALRAPFKVGDLLVPQTVLDDEGRQYFVAHDLFATITSRLSRSDFDIRDCTLLSTRKIINSASEKSVLAARFGADAVDMESAAIAAVAQQAQIPFAVVRVVSDGARQNIPYAVNGAIDCQGRVIAARLGVAMMARPWELIGLLRLGLASARASVALEAALRSVLREQS